MKLDPLLEQPQAKHKTVAAGSRLLMLDLQRRVIDMMTDDDWDVSITSFDILVAKRADVTIKYRVISGLLTYEDVGPHPSLATASAPIANGVESTATKIVELIEMSNVKRELDAQKLPDLSATIVGDDHLTLFIKVHYKKSVVKSIAVYNERGKWVVNQFTTMATSIPSSAASNADLLKLVNLWYKTDKAPE